MTSKIKVDNINKVSDDSNIINKSGTTITLGASGDTINLASGASQSGFGRTGTVDWQTGSIKTATFTAANGEGYFCNTSAGAFNITLPSSPSAGDIVALKDYNGTFNTNNLTIDRNGSPLNGASSNFALTVDNTSMTLVYVDGIEGWMAVEEGTGFIGENFMEATGGTITTCGNDRIHTFTGPGTFCVSSVADCSANNQVSYLVVAGGGGAGYYYGAGGGAGGFREDKSPTTTYTASPLDGAGDKTVTATGFPVTVGAGGASATYPTTLGNNGSSSTVFSITSAGGGAGNGSPSGGSTGNNGGSGGGGGGRSGNARTGGSGNTPSVSPPQGNNGGTIPTPGNDLGAGGGGAGSAAATSGPDCSLRTGAVGAGTAINPAAGTPGPSGSLKYFSGGGAGGPNAPGVAGGAGGGGNYNTAGTANTGGGAGADVGGGSPPTYGGGGGSGIVIIRYKFQ
tara:strand:- start:5 stop:1366 length:1362 start_codon:yes stop_codon:yes gene_type:complete